MKVHFKGLNTLRAIAALVVMLGHVELLKTINKVPNLFSNEAPTIPSGHIAVVLFFVISGFLITFLLVKEKEKTGNISFRKFYMRRILRIWPLYYTVLILSLLLFRVDYNPTTLALCFSIFPNIAHALSIGWPTSPQIWSIGVEEQFYLFWPLVINLIPQKRTITILLLFIIGYSLLPHLIGFINVRTFDNAEWAKIINRFFYGTRFNCMAIGALLGYLYAKKHSALNFFYKSYIAYPAIFFSFSLWFYGIKLTYFTAELYAILFGIMVLNITTNRQLKIRLESKLFNFLGKISYGIYMYHWIVILLVMEYMPYHPGDNYVYYNIQLYSIVLMGTIFFSWVSYNTLEKYFLNFKKSHRVS